MRSQIRGPCSDANSMEGIIEPLLCGVPGSPLIILSAILYNLLQFVAGGPKGGPRNLFRSTVPPREAPKDRVEATV